MIYYLLFIWIVYIFFESYSFEMRLWGHLIDLYPLGVSYSNVVLTICRFLNILITLPIAYYLDSMANKGVAIDDSLVAFCFPLGAIISCFLFAMINKRYNIKLASMLFKLERDNVDGIFKKIRTKKFKFNKKISFLMFVMFFSAYSAFPLIVIWASKYPGYRSTILQSIVIFSGVYSLIFTIVIDPMFSKKYNSIIFSTIYSQFLKIRNFSILYICPVFTGFFYYV